MSKPPLRWEQQDEGVWLIRAEKPGPTVGILGGVHGDEPAGAVVVKELVTSQFEIECGTLIVMLGNPPAVDAGRHYVDYNLNRSFLDDDAIDPKVLPKTAYEYKRSRVLLAYVRKCEALLDLHQHYGPEVPPFIICERDTLKTSKHIGAPVIAFGFSRTEPGGSDSYMHGLKRQGLCYELGANLEHFEHESVMRGRMVVERFLHAQGMRDKLRSPLHEHPLMVETKTVVKRQPGEFWIDPSLNTFDRLTPGKLIAINGGEGWWAEPGQVIIFPDPEAPIGDECFTLGTIVTE